MKKRIITVAAFAACLALCAAVWPRNEPAGETPAPTTPAAVIATQPEVPEIAEMEEVIPPEEEKAEATLQELVEETDIVPVLASGDNRHSGSGEKRQFWSTENSHLQFE